MIARQRSVNLRSDDLRGMFLRGLDDRHGDAVDPYWLESDEDPDSRSTRSIGGRQNVQKEMDPKNRTRT